MFYADDNANQIDLPFGARLLKQTMKVSSYRPRGNSEGGGDGRNVADFNQGPQHPQFARREPVQVGR